MWSQLVADSVLVPALVLGGLGGAAVVLTLSLSRRGPLVFVPYFALAVAIAALFAGSEGVSYADRVFAAFAAFLVTTLGTYLAVRVLGERARKRRRQEERSVGAAPGMSAWGHAWRIGAVVAVGFTASMIVALIGA